MIKYLNLFFFVLIFSFTSSIYAQKYQIDSTLNNRTNSINFESNALFKCKIRLPINYNPQEKYNLVIGLHGGGGSLEQFITIWDSLHISDFIYAVPQAPYPWLLNKNIGYDWALWPTGNEIIIKQASNLIVKYIKDLAVSLKKNYNIGDVYLFGFSQGAVYTYIAGIKNYSDYKGLIIHSGPGLLEPLVSPFTGESYDSWLEKDYLKPAKNLRIFIAHGKDDKRVNYELGIKSKNVLTELGYEVTFQNFEGGHSVDKKILESVIEWLKK